MGAALTQAESWRTKRSEDISAFDREFIDQSARRENKARARVRRLQALIYVLLVGIIIGLIGVLNQAYVKEEWNWYWTMRPYRIANFDSYVLTAEAEGALEPGKSFRECAKDCPEMVKVPAGEFMMGSPANEKGRHGNESPQHKVILAKPFAVSKFKVTFKQWDACVAVGGCGYYRPSDASWGRLTRPVIYVNWDDAQNYVAWLSKMTGQTYRLLSEAEWEYAARAGTQTAYSWGDEIGKNNANCNSCGSPWDKRLTAPVGEFASNPYPFLLYDMAGNVWEWVQDCYDGSYNGAPTDGSPRTSGDCSKRVRRGGAWDDDPEYLRSAARYWHYTDFRGNGIGFRVGRTLTR